jgi:ligand-binding sensor domain-containing protein
MWTAVVSFMLALTALGDEYTQTVWTTQDGLPQNSVTAILQTADGYLWLGTLGGLVRFDGVRFTTFNTANNPGLKSNRILALTEARDGTLWIGTEEGSVMSFRNGAARSYTTAEGLPGGLVWTLGYDSAGRLWAGTANGLARLDDGRFKVFTTDKGLPDNQVFALGCRGQAVGRDKRRAGNVAR